MGGRRIRPQLSTLIAVVSFGLAILLIVSVFLIARIPAVAAQIPQTPTIATLTFPLNGSIVPLHSTVPVTAEAIGEAPITRLELWVDGGLWGTRDASAVSRQLNGVWDWTPSGEGEHVLLVRALDSAGRIAVSNVVRTNASQAADLLVGLEYAAVEGDTLQSLAEDFGTSRELIAAANPELDPASPIPEGEPLTIPVPIPNAPPDGPLEDASPLPPPGAPMGETPPGPNRLSAWLQFNLLPSTGEAPKPPALSAESEGCRVRLAIQHPEGGEAGIQIYRLLPGGAAFTPLTTLGSIQGEAVVGLEDAVPGGHIEYYAAAFNASGQSLSAIRSVDVEAAGCAAISPDVAGFELVGGSLLPTEPVDMLYLYLSVNRGPWERVPGDPDAFLFPEDGSFDLRAHMDFEALAALPEPVPFAMEVWGWRAGQLVSLGTQSGLVGPPDDLGSSFWTFRETRLEAFAFRFQGRDFFAYQGRIPTTSQQLEKTFRWRTAADGATKALWQISTQPFPAGPGAAPAGLVGHGEVAGSGGEFLLDFSPFVPQTGQGSGLSSLFEQIGSVVGSAVDSVGQTESPLPPVTRSFSSLLPRTFYVRILPMMGNQFVGGPSNTVIIHYGPPKPPPVSSLTGAAYEARVVSFTPYRPADPAYEACFLSTRDWDICTDLGGDPLSGPQVCYTIPAGSPIYTCPGGGFGKPGGGGDIGDFLQEGFEAVAGAVSKVASFVSSLYNELKEFVVNTLAKLAQCDKLGGKASAVCEQAISIGVNAGLASLGLPPEIPDFEDLMESGLEYAVEMAAAELGVDCDEFCKDLIRRGIQAVSDPERLLDEGVEYGINLAQEELAKQGINCDQTCQDLIKGSVEEGGAPFGGLDPAAVAAERLRQQGYTCTVVCENIIRNSLASGESLVGGVSGQGSAAIQEPFFAPHPLALEQPAVVQVEVTRRLQSGGVPKTDLERCGVSVFSEASNFLAGRPVSGEPFYPIGMDIPPLEPGKRVVIPILLERAPWYPAEDGTGTPPQVGPGGVIVAGFADPVLGQWHALYYGSQVTLTLGGPNFLTLGDDGNLVSLPCVEGASWSEQIPAP